MTLTAPKDPIRSDDAHVVKPARFYWLLPAESRLTRRLFGSTVRRIAALAVPTG